MRKITVSKILAVSLLPVIAAPVCSVASCSKVDVKVNTVSPEINLNNGDAKFELTLNQQPADNKAEVSVENLEGEHNIQIYTDEQQPYSGSSTIICPVEDHKLNVHACFDTFIGKSTTTTFGLSIKYLNKNNEVTISNIQGLKLELKYNQQPGKEKVHIYSINDFHGAAPGYGDDYFNVSSKTPNPGVIRIAQTITPLLEQYPGSIFVTAGDNNSGETYSTCMHGETLYPTLSAMGARYSAVGNHAFEWGIDYLEKYRFDNWARTDETQGNYFINGNILNGTMHRSETWEADPANPDFEEDYLKWKASRIKWADPYKLINMNGHLVCLMGLTTTQTLSDGNQSVVRNLTFVSYDASVSYITKLCHDEIGDDWFNKIESIILLTHIESEQEAQSDPEGGAAVLGQQLHMAKYLDKFDAIISGHSHKVVRGSVINEFYGKDHPIWIGQAETAGRRYLDLTLCFDNSKPVGSRYDIFGSDETVTKIEICPGIETPTKQQAAEELAWITQHPATPAVTKTIDTYNLQKQVVQNRLSSVIAQTKYGLEYPIHQAGDVGHKYFCSSSIIDQMGAWANLAQTIGFASYFQEEIGDPKTNVVQPCISFTNIDSINTEIPKPLSPLSPEDVLLRNMYDIQTYENTLYFGFLSVWQLANIIDYLLSGKTKFVYGATNNGDYMIEDDEPLLNTRHDLRVNIRSGDTVIACCDEILASPEGNFCCYPCGPLQWYGIQFEIEKETDSFKYLDQEYRLKYVEPESEELKKLYKQIPSMRIYDPEKGSNIYQPSTWTTAEGWLLKKDDHLHPKLIPCVINNFIYDGGNDQCRMFEPYFTFNELHDDKLYEVHHYSQITRDMLIEYCRLTTDEATRWLYHFDLEVDAVKKLVIWPK